MTQAHPMIMKSIPDLTTLKAGFPTVKTLLFDMDGTLFDTEKYHSKALQNIGREQSISPPYGPEETHKLMMGKADHLLFDLIQDWPGFPKAWDVHKFVSEKNRHLLLILGQVKGSTIFALKLKELLDEAKLDGLQIGLVTSSEKVITHELLKLTGLSQFFDYILTRDDTEKVKPDPWPYVTAMKFFNSSPGETLIFEDSNVGMQAAHGSGAHVVKVEWY